MHILVVEDDQRMADLIRQGLTEEGHAVVVSGDGREALSIAGVGSFDLILMDVMLPGMSGFNVVKCLRAEHNRTPILILTARDAITDMIEGLDIGADDYLTKPFSFDLLFARVRAVGRRGPIPQPVELTAADLCLNQSSREVRRGGELLYLTKTEYSMLELLMRSAGRVVERESLIASIWGADTDIESNTLDAFVRLLRAKVERPDEPRLIHTVRGVGYRLQRGEE